MYTTRGKEKPKTTIAQVEEALNKLLGKLKAQAVPREIAIAEEKVNATVLAYVRYETHWRFSHDDPARMSNTSSELSGEILKRLYMSQNLPGFLQKLKDEQTEEAKLACIKWLRKMVSNNAWRIPIDWSRKKIVKTHPDHETNLAIINNESSKHDDPEALATGAESAKIVEQVMAGLSSEDDAIIKYRFVDGLTFREIAVELGLEQSTVRKRYNKLFGDLKSILNEKGIEF